MGVIWTQNIFGRSYLFFVNVGAPKRQLTMIFLRNRLKLFYKTIIFGSFDLFNWRVHYNYKELLQLKFKNKCIYTKCKKVRPSQQKRAQFRRCKLHYHVVLQHSDVASGTGMNVVQLWLLQCADQGHERMTALRRPAHPMSQSQWEWIGKRRKATSIWSTSVIPRRSPQLQIPALLG